MLLVKTYLNDYISINVLLKTGVIKNVVSKPYKSKQTLERVHFERL